MSRPINHFAVVPVPPEFSPVVLRAAEAENISYGEAFLKMAIAGAECRRNHEKKVNHKRTKK